MRRLLCLITAPVLGAVAYLLGAPAVRDEIHRYREHQRALDLEEHHPRLADRIDPLNAGPWGGLLDLLWFLGAAVLLCLALYVLVLAFRRTPKPSTPPGWGYDYRGGGSWTMPGQSESRPLPGSPEYEEAAADRLEVQQHDWERQQRKNAAIEREITRQDFRRANPD